uniref:Uncharacterized protein n=1 Tax=Arundo donax TaxID=35708 RepID=A0A0A9CRW5_ARUDO
MFHKEQKAQLPRSISSSDPSSATNHVAITSHVLVVGFRMAVQMQRN